MEENRPMKFNLKMLLPEVATMLLIAGGIYAYSFWTGTGNEIMLRNVVISVLGIAIAGFLFRQDYVTDGLDYNNSRHPLRFWVAVWISMVISFVCVFLPLGGWPFLPVFVLLSLFSNISVGVLASSSLLMISVLLTDASAGVFFLYFISGIFAASLFNHLKNEFTIGIPWFLSMLCLLVCETANIVLTANEQLNYEQFLVPVANLMVCSMLLLGILKVFSDKVVYQYRDFYLEWNDTENPVLTEYKESDRNLYFGCMHTAFFCERIAMKLSLDSDALKCAGYYHKMKNQFEEFVKVHKFPPAVVTILREYHASPTCILHKETAVLICADTIINSIQYLLNKNNDRKIDYEQVIDAVFKKFHDAGTFKKCNITMQELNTMQKIFKEEKLYYDFLR